MVNDLPELMTLQQVADYLGTTTRTVRRWIAGGKLKQVKLGWRTVRITKEAVGELLRHK